jgi:nicotinate-nucleotide adenylyltransferase
VQLGLDRVALLPVSTPPHKQASDDPGPEARLELCRRAVAGADGLEVLDLEVARGGPSFTVDTLRALHATGSGDDLTFIVGGDMALSLPTWREPEEVLRLARLGVAERSGAVRADIEDRLAPLGGRIDFFDMPRIDLSSTDVRARVAAGRPVRYLVPDAVAAYIAEKGLYR